MSPVRYHPHPERWKTVIVGSGPYGSRRCQAATASGKQCRNAALRDSELCGIHLRQQP